MVASGTAGDVAMRLDQSGGRDPSLSPPGARAPERQLAVTTNIRAGAHPPLQAWRSRSEQGFDFPVFGEPSREIVEFEGLHLVAKRISE